MKIKRIKKLKMMLYLTLQWQFKNHKNLVSYPEYVKNGKNREFKKP